MDTKRFILASIDDMYEGLQENLLHEQHSLDQAQNYFPDQMDGATALKPARDALAKKFVELSQTYKEAKKLIGGLYA